MGDRRAGEHGQHVVHEQAADYRQLLLAVVRCDMAASQLFRTGACAALEGRSGPAPSRAVAPMAPPFHHQLVTESAVRLARGRGNDARPGSRPRRGNGYNSRTALSRGVLRRHHGRAAGVCAPEATIRPRGRAVRSSVSESCSCRSAPSPEHTTARASRTRGACKCSQTRRLLDGEAGTGTGTGTGRGRGGTSWGGSACFALDDARDDRVGALRRQLVLAAVPSDSVDLDREEHPLEEVGR